MPVLIHAIMVIKTVYKGPTQDSKGLQQVMGTHSMAIIRLMEPTNIVLRLAAKRLSIMTISPWSCKRSLVTNSRILLNQDRVLCALSLATITEDSLSIDHPSKSQCTLLRLHQAQTTSYSSLMSLSCVNRLVVLSL